MRRDAGLRVGLVGMGLVLAGLVAASTGVLLVGAGLVFVVCAWDLLGPNGLYGRWREIIVNEAYGRGYAAGRDDMWKLIKGRRSP